MKLPRTLRPRNSSTRTFKPGLEISYRFLDDLKSIDSNFYLVWHPYRVMWDDIINEYTGTLDDPRFTIHQEHGQENWGFVLTNPNKTPIIENAWHLWRLCEPHGWGHILRIEDESPEYLNLIIRRLHLQVSFRNRYGDLAWNKHLQATEAKLKEKMQKDSEEMLGAVHDENSWLMKRAMDNMQRGVVKPTNPMHESIVSYPGQKNRSKLVRPLDDDDVGLVGLKEL